MRQTTSDRTDRQLLEAYMAGRDLSAFEAFVERHQGALLAYASAVLRDPTGAQDVVQEAFMRAARNPQRVLLNPSGGGERNWLLKVVRDLSIDSLRRKAVERRVIENVRQTATGTAPSPEVQAETRERRDEVLAAIQRLKPRLRDLLILKVREQKSYKEIAEITGLTATNVGFLLHQAMSALSAELKE